MAAVLTGIGLAIVQGRERIGPRLAAVARRVPAGARLVRAMPWAVAIVVLAGGVVLTGQALTQTL
jgi:hypothetical protein